MTVLIASPLEREHVERIRAVGGVDEVLYAPDLVAPPRYPNDHGGDPAFAHDDAMRARWHALVERADVLFGYPHESSDRLRDVLDAGRRVRFVQGTSAGMGAHVKRAGLSDDTLARVRFASAAGVHAAMLAEFTFYGLLALRKDAARLADIRARRAWDHYAMGELDGSTIGILGTGQIGRAIARRARAFGMHAIGIARTDRAQNDFDETVATGDLEETARRVDALAVTLPATDLTHHLVDARVLRALGPQAIVVNVGRGSVIDQAELTALLRDRRITGAVLDVFEREPLPPDDPLWSLPNVVASPHTAALSIHENARIVALFCENLARLQRGEPLRNALNLEEFY